MCPSAPDRPPGAPSAATLAEYERLLDERRAAAARGADAAELGARIRALMRAHRLGEECPLDGDGNP